MQKRPQDDSEISDKSEGSETAASSDSPSVSEKRFVYLDISWDGLPSRRIVIELHFDVAPQTCENFWQLCVKSTTIGSHGKPLWYNGSFIHRIQSNFMVQGGDIINYDGTGGESIYGPFFKDENFDMPLTAGTIGMVNNGKADTNSSQYFIALVNFPHLDGKNVGFGKVVKGLKNLEEISNLPNLNNAPVVDVMITDCGALPLDKADWNYGEKDGLDRYPAYPQDYEPPIGSLPENSAKDLQQVITNIKDQGNIYFSKKDYQNAIHKYNKALRYLVWCKSINEQNSFVDLTIACLSNLAKAHLCCKNFRPAHEHCSEVLKLRDSAKAYFRRGQANHGLHNYDAALEDLAKAQSLEPRNKEIFQEIRAVKIAKEQARSEEKLRSANMFK